jgi:predicted RNA methylase
MKYFEMHDEVYEGLAKNGKVSWDGGDSPEKLFNHEINIALAERIDHYFPQKEGKKAIDFGCGTGTAALYLSSLGFSLRGFDVSPKAIDMANQNKEALNLKAEFKACDLTELSGLEADLTVDSSLLHCLVDSDHRKKFFELCSDLTFIHTMIEAEDMSEMTDQDYLTFKDGVLWSTGPDRWDMDWHDIDGQKMFKHRRISSEKEFLQEVKDNGFEILEYYLKSQEKSSSTLVGWIKRKK